MFKEKFIIIDGEKMSINDKMFISGRMKLFYRGMKNPDNIKENIIFPTFSNPKIKTWQQYKRMIYTNPKLVKLTIADFKKIQIEILYMAKLVGDPMKEPHLEKKIYHTRVFNFNLSTCVVVKPKDKKQIDPTNIAVVKNAFDVLNSSEQKDALNRFPLSINTKQIKIKKQNFELADREKAIDIAYAFNNRLNELEQKELCKLLLPKTKCLIM